ncbi:hypothetical protein DNFV4_01731 [Nitrospira tepida]|uniref:Uncharacterized protein n=1 Tax=Nitrospira tepida TaxID=2973512 RepID=A0AA86MYA4_9BACT|nr:hypothetical protein DNFV4_01731 [Nitrospira tepida]
MPATYRWYSAVGRVCGMGGMFGAFGSLRRHGSPLTPGGQPFKSDAVT